jgi:hypothetical protein
MSAIGGKADIPDLVAKCPLMTHNSSLSGRRRDAHFLQSLMRDDPRALQRKPCHDHQRPFGSDCQSQACRRPSSVL